MRKLLTLFLIIILFASFSLANDYITVEVQDEISYLKPFGVKLIFTDDEVREYGDVIYISMYSDSVPSFIIDNNHELPDYIKKEGHNNSNLAISYEGQKEILLTLIPTSSAISYSKKMQDVNFALRIKPIWDEDEKKLKSTTRRTISKKFLDEIRIQTKFAPLEASIDFPNGTQALDNSDYLVLSYYTSGVKDTMYDMRVFVDPYSGAWSDALKDKFPLGAIEETYLSHFEEIVNNGGNSFSAGYGEETYRGSMQGLAASIKADKAYAYQSLESYKAGKMYERDPDQEMAISYLYAIVFYPQAKVTFSLKKKSRVEEGQGANQADSDLKELEKIASSFRLDDGVVSATYSADSSDEFEETECGECRAGYVCTVCGDCIKEGKAVFPDKLKLDADMSIDISSSTIKNVINALEVARVTVRPKLLNVFRKEVDYCQLTEEPEDIILYATLIDNSTEDMATGLTTGHYMDKRERRAECKISLKEKKKTCAFPIAARDDRKVVDYFFDPGDSYIFELKDKRGDYVTTAQAADIKIVNPEVELKTRSRSNQVQEGTEMVFEFMYENKHSKNSVIKISMVGIGDFGLSRADVNKRQIVSVMKSNEWHKIVYKAPRLGNFDIGQQLSTLSMTELQTQAAFQIAEDAIIAYGNSYAGNLEGMVNSGKYLKQMGDLTDAYKIANGVRTLKGFNAGIPGLEKDVAAAIQVQEGKKDAGFLENAADIGIAGIGAAQMAVGVLTFVPNKIPGVSKLTANVQVAFSAMTNIWKANLKYISQAEKIDRAEELFYPVTFIITSQDESGWVIQEPYVMKVAYQRAD